MRSSLISILLSLGLAVVVAFWANSWLDRQLAEPEPTRVVPVVIAAKTIPLGTEIDPTHLRIAELPPEAIPEGTFSEPDEVLGEVVKETVYNGDAVRRSRLLGDDDGNLLSARLEPGMRAMTVSVNDVSGVAGFLLPGGRVDVIAVDRRGPARTVIQDVQILAADQQLQPDGSSAIRARAVTLAVDPRQAEVLAEATEQGSVRLTLRNQGDRERTAPPAAPRPPVLVSAGPAPPEPDRTIRPTGPGPVSVRVAPDAAYPPDDAVAVIRGTSWHDGCRWKEPKDGDAPGPVAIRTLAPCSESAP